MHQRKMLIRIIVSAVLFVAALIVHFTVEMPTWGGFLLFFPIYILIGYDILLRAAKNIVKGKVFDENFLMTVATIGAFAILEFPEGAVVMLIYQIGEYFQSYAVEKSRKSIAELMGIRPDTARVVVDGTETEIVPEEVKPGDIIMVKSGEKIPLDGTVVNGESALDTSSLTGEALPRNCQKGDYVLSGAINLGGVLEIRADKAFYDSTVSKILDLVENASAKKAKAENFITKFAKYYTPAVVIAAFLLAVIPPIIDGQWSSWIQRALTFLVVSCPCALVLSVPLSFFGGIGGASKAGILIKGGNYMELLDKADTYVFDKTGTLTEGTFEVRHVVPEEKREEILALAAIAESGSLHPIAKSILKEAKPAENGYALHEYAGKGVMAEKQGKIILAGNAALMEQFGIEYVPDFSIGTVVYVALNGQFVGSVLISDVIKKDAAEVVGYLKAGGSRVIMLTGDNASTARQVAESAGIEEYKAQLLPGQKVEELEKILSAKAKGAVVFVGDGINDAPVLMRADLGIAMGGLGSDSAIEAADVVLMHDKLSDIPKARLIARKTMGIVRQNIWFALSVKALVLALSAAGYAGMWAAVLADVGVAVLAILNAMRAQRAPRKRRYSKQ